MGWTADEHVPLNKKGEEGTLQEALLRHYEITVLTKPLLEQAAGLTSTPALKELLPRAAAGAEGVHPGPGSAGSYSRLWTLGCSGQHLRDHPAQASGPACIPLPAAIMRTRMKYTSRYEPCGMSHMAVSVMAFARYTVLSVYSRVPPCRYISRTIRTLSCPLIPVYR